MPKKAKKPDSRKAAAVTREQRKREIRTAKLGNAREAIGKIKPRCEIYVLTFGQFSLIEALEAILEQTGPAFVDLSTWTAAHADLDRSSELMQTLSIERLRFLVDTSFINRQPGYVRHMRGLFGDDCIRTLRSHAKFAAIYNDRYNIAVRTSMNLNTNPRLENLEISDDPALCGFLRSITDTVFAEHAAGDFHAMLPELDDLANVEMPGYIGNKYPEPSADKKLKPKPPTTGKPAN